MECLYCKTVENMRKTSFIGSLISFWKGEGGARELLAMAFPLILSTSTWTIQQTVDRLFLTWYSPETIAASLPSGMLNFTLQSIFIGAVGYVSTFIAQYFGAGHERRIGQALWQSIYLALIGTILVMAFVPLAPFIFNHLGHDPAVARYEIIYFQILTLGVFPSIMNSALSGFFSGLNKTMHILGANSVGTIVLIVLDYGLIFGHFGFPRLGILGAGIATIMASTVTMIYYAFFIFNAANEKKYKIRSDRKFNAPLFWRILYFGFPSGIQFFLDIIGIAVFLLLVGRYGTDALAASNISFTINSIAFMPMIGISIAISILVGQYLGANKVDKAVKIVKTAFTLAFTYMSIVAVLYLTIPDFFLNMYRSHAGNTGDFARIHDTAVIILRFIAVYCFFDSLTIVFISVLKGAGDTVFVMLIAAMMTIFVLIVPSYIVMVKMNAGLYAGWLICSIYVCCLGISFFLRYLTGKWKKMRVIEPDLVVRPNCPNPNMPSCVE